MRTRQIKLGDALLFHDEGGIVLVQIDEFSDLHRLQEYRRMVNPMTVSCKLEFNGSYKRKHMNTNTPCILITGD